MKVILQRDVAKLGTRFSVVEVPDGYAQNKLIPQGMAQPATPQNLKRLESRRAHKETEQADAAAQFVATCQKLADTPITLTVEANEQGHLFQAVKPADIVGAAEAAGVTLEVSTIALTDTIKEVGEYTVPLAHGESTGVLQLHVTKK